jgi:hypothetical protein
MNYVKKNLHMIKILDFSGDIGSQEEIGYLVLNGLRKKHPMGICCFAGRV